MYCSDFQASMRWRAAFHASSWISAFMAALVGRVEVKLPISTTPQLPAFTPSACAAITPRPFSSSPSWSSPGA
jgi:hypothetical protein